MTDSIDPNLIATDAAALRAYIKLIEAKGASKGSVYKRKHFLQYLLTRLKGKPLTSQSYGEALTSTLKVLANDENRYFFQAVAREFYYLWIEDLKAVAVVSAAGGYGREPFKIEISGSLDEIFDQLADVLWEDNERSSMRAYIQVLKSQGADAAIVERHEKLAMLLLSSVRGLPVNGNTYRAAVESIAPLFNAKANHQFFIAMARTFFHFWSGDVSAQQRLRS